MTTRFSATTRQLLTLRETRVSWCRFSGVQSPVFCSSGWFGRFDFLARAFGWIGRRKAAARLGFLPAWNIGSTPAIRVAVLLIPFDALLLLVLLFTAGHAAPFDAVVRRECAVTKG